VLLLTCHLVGDQKLLFIINQKKEKRVSGREGKIWLKVQILVKQNQINSRQLPTTEKVCSQYFSTLSWYTIGFSQELICLKESFFYLD